MKTSLGPIWGDNVADPILSISNIETYYGPIVAIRGISLDVEAGRIVTLAARTLPPPAIPG